MGLVRDHGEADIGGPHGFFPAGDRETGNEATGWNLVTGGCQDCSEVGRDSGITYIHRQAPIYGVTVGSPPDHIQSLHAGYRVLGWGEETEPVVASDGSGCPTEGYAKRDFCRRTSAIDGNLEGMARGVISRDHIIASDYRIWSSGIREGRFSVEMRTLGIYDTG